MSRFADRSKVQRLDLGDGDWVDLRADLSGSEWADAFDAAGQGNGPRLQALFISSWNLKDDAGEQVPVTEDACRSLDLDTFVTIDKWIAANMQRPKLPNASSEPSPGGSRAARTRTPKTPTNGSSTTPSWQPAVTGTSGTALPSS